MNDAQKKEFERIFTQYKKCQMAEVAEMAIAFLWENGDTCGMEKLKVESLVDLLAELRECLMKGDG